VALRHRLESERAHGHLGKALLVVVAVVDDESFSGSSPAVWPLAAGPVQQAKRGTL
jgi:hypothetical protein